MLNGKTGKRAINGGGLLNGTVRILKPQMHQKTSPRNGQEFGFGTYLTQNLGVIIMGMI